MIEGHDIVCFSNEFDGDHHSKKQIINRFAQKNRVLWINSPAIRKPNTSEHDATRLGRKVSNHSHTEANTGDGMLVCAHLAVPFYGNSVGRWLNRESLRWTVRRMCRKLGFRNPISWVFDPTSADIVGSLSEKAIIYHCVDEGTESTGGNGFLLEMERRLIAKANCVIVSSDRLKARKFAHHPYTFLVTHGVDVDHFRKACRAQTPVPDEMTAFRRPIIGLFGLIGDYVDVDLIRFLADSRPEWEFVLIGRVVTDIRIFDGVSNIHILGRKPYHLLPNYAKAFDLAIVPFIVSDLARTADPSRIHECLAAGLPVVSTPIPEATRMKSVIRIARHKLDFLTKVESIVESGLTGPQISISQQMESESWDHKLEEISAIFSETSVVKAKAAA